MRNHFNVKLHLFILCLGVWSTINAQIIEVNSIQCFGDSTGELAVYSNFGTAPYTYLWNNGQTTQNIDGLNSGIYSVTVTESLGGTQNYSYTLNDPPLLTATYTLTDNSSWPVNSGSILINASGGTGWYNYSVYDSTSRIITNQVDPFFDLLASGAYYITTSDLYNCRNTDTVYILENAGLPVVMTIDTTACYMSTAPTSVEPSLAGVYPVVVNFDNSSVFTIIDTVMGPRPYVMSTIVDTLSAVSDQFEPGFHLVTVSAADGMGFRYSWTVDSVVAPISIAWTQSDNLCFGNNNGAIASIAQGSYNGYTYLIIGPGGFSVNTSSANSLFAGEYTITATDFTGCSLTQSILITQPDEPLRVDFDHPTNPRCPYSADGEIVIHQIEGAISPVTYLWSDGSNMQKIDSLFPGTYSVIVTDANNCTVQDSISLIADRRACIFNVVTPNGDGYNDYLDLSDLCIGMNMQAEIFNEAGKKIAVLNESNPRWDASDPSNPPTGTSSTYTVFIDLTKNNQPYMKWAESFSVIYSK
ncbi:MAG: gliding motility-associated C-terminal domain-containing protein [Bacteroidota bacterium]